DRLGDRHRLVVETEGGERDSSRPVHQVKHLLVGQSTMNADARMTRSQPAKGGQFRTVSDKVDREPVIRAPERLDGGVCEYERTLDTLTTRNPQECRVLRQLSRQRDWLPRGRS